MDERLVIRDPNQYYVAERPQGVELPWLLVNFTNHWFNIIDLRAILKENKDLCPYDDLQLRLLHPNPPQKLLLSRYKEALQNLDCDMWLEEIIPNLGEISQSCHCHEDFPDEPRIQNHVVTGNLKGVMKDDVILDRLLRGPNFRECPGTKFELVYKDLEDVLLELRLMHTAPPVHFELWMKNVLASFKKAHRSYLRNTSSRQQAAELLPVRGSLKSRTNGLKSYFERYTLLVADKSRGNFVLVCNNLFRFKCVEKLSQAQDYRRVDENKDTIVASIARDLMGLLNHKHTDMLQDKLSYFYLLPKLHKNPVGWRPFAACHESILEVPHRIIGQCLGVVLNTIKHHHAEEFRRTGIRKFWIVKNSLD